MYRRRRIVAAVVLVLALAVGGYLPLTLLTPLDAAVAEVSTPEAVVVDAGELDWPSYGIAAIAPLDVPGAIEEWGSEEVRPLASIVKVVTALVVLDAHPLSPGEDGPTITTDASDVGYRDRLLAQGGKVLPVAVGQRYTQRDLMELTLIESSNNHAVSLVSWAYGSEAAFVETAQEWVSARGLDSIRVVEPTGIDPRNVGSAPDLVALGRLALADPLVAELVSSRTETAANVGPLRNTNILLGQDGVDGIKTGTLFEHGANLLFSADLPVDDRLVTFVGVALGAPNHTVLAGDVRSLLASAQERMTVLPLIRAGDEIARYTTPWGAESTLVATEDADILLWGDAEATATVEVEELLTATAGTVLGRVVFQVGDRVVEVPLELTTTIDDPGPWWRLTNPGTVLGGS